VHLPCSFYRAPRSRCDSHLPVLGPVVQQINKIHKRKEVMIMTTFEVLNITLLMAANIQLALIIVKMGAKKG
jgi:hypothetical protein